MLTASERMIAPGIRRADDARSKTRRRVKPVPVTRPLPMHHASKAIHVEGMPRGWTARVLLLRKLDGSIEAYSPLVSYMTEHRFRSATWQNNAARGVGLLWDFFRAHAVADPGAFDGVPWRRKLIRAFALALVTGTVDPETGHDTLGLFWPHMPHARARTLLRSVDAFMDWHHAEWMDRADVPQPSIKEPSLPEDAFTLSDMLIWARLRKISMLEHLKKPARIKLNPAYEIGPDPRGQSAKPVKFFPADRAADLVFNGHVRPGRVPRGMQPTNVRDQMIALLCCWGGLRRSEAFHLWVSDVTMDPNRPGCALVVLHHPSDAKVTYRDGFGAEVTLTRKEFLAREHNGLLPRHHVLRGRYHAGWKGMDLDGDLRAVVHWLDEAAGRVFFHLYSVYLRDRALIMDLRRKVGLHDHPFLFVSEGPSRQTGSRAAIGDPYSMKAYDGNHRAAVKRLGLRHGRKHGTGTHSLRHAYGQALTGLGLSAEVIRKAMRHRSHLSQVVYTAPGDAKVSDALNAARKAKAAAAVASGSLDPPGSESALALYALSRHVTTGEPND